MCTGVDVPACMHRSSHVRMHPHTVVLCAYTPNFVHTCVCLCVKSGPPHVSPLPHAHMDQTRLTEPQVSSVLLHTVGWLPNGITAKSTDARARLPGFKSWHVSSKHHCYSVSAEKGESIPYAVFPVSAKVSSLLSSFNTYLLNE